jgi:polyisoprenoid-binding protein YceI
VDPQGSAVGFAVKDLWGLRTVRGIFGAYDGSLTVRSGDVSGELLIAAGSLDTGHTRRDQHLRSPVFFDVERHPRMVFATTAATAWIVGVTVTGELAIGSSRVRLEIPVNVERLGDGALRLEGRTTVARQTAGLEQAGDDPRRRRAARPAHAPASPMSS